MRRLSRTPRDLETCKKYRYRVVKSSDLDRMQEVTTRRRQWDWHRRRFITHNYRVLLYESLEKLYPGAAFLPYWERAEFLKDYEVNLRVAVYPDMPPVASFTLIVRITPA